MEESLSLPYCEIEFAHELIPISLGNSLVGSKINFSVSTGFSSIKRNWILTAVFYIKKGNKKMLN